jgi:AcrR family transcriptional regulator
MERTRPRPGGRSARIRAAVLDAVAAIIAENEVGGLTIEAVAQRAGVARTTVYRRWPTRSSLIADLLVSRARVEIPAPDTGTLEGDLTTLTTAAAAALRGPNLAILRAAVSASAADEDMATAFGVYWFERTRIVATIIERAVQRGEAPAGTDPGLVLQASAGPLWLAALSHATASPTDTSGPTTDDRATGIPTMDAHARRVAHVVAAAVRAGAAARDVLPMDISSTDSTARPPDAPLG